VIWVAVQWGAAVFGAFFGGLFAFEGARRVARAAAEPNPGEARLWGSVGVVVGAAMLAGVAWLTLGHLLR
jgi:hypothetical protein